MIADATVSFEDAQACFTRVLKSEEFKKSGKCRKTLELLWNRMASGEGPLKAGDLCATIEDRKQVLSDDKEKIVESRMRALVGTLRKKLDSYANRCGDFIKLSILTEDGYQLIAQPYAPSQCRSLFIFRSRDRTRAWFNRTMLGVDDDDRPLEDVLYVSAASHGTLDFAEPLFKNKRVRARHFRVLTMLPESVARDRGTGWQENLATAFAEHLDEDAARLDSNILSAWQTWKRIEKENDFVEVYGYRSIPTLQGICDGTTLKVELLPFNKKDLGYHACGSPEARPALFLNADESPAAFRLFKNAFEDLWCATMAATPEGEVPDDDRRRRRAQRLACLVVSPTQNSSK